MNFKEDFEYYLQKTFEELELNYPHTIKDIVRHVDVNYIIPLKSELFTLTNLLKPQQTDNEKTKSTKNT